MCKQRIGVWARRFSKSLVDIPLWDRIQEAFPRRVELRLAGVDEDAEELEEMFPTVAIHQYAESGTIKKEFEQEMLEIDQEREEKRREEERLSLELIESMAQEEGVPTAGPSSSSQSIKRNPLPGTILAYTTSSASSDASDSGRLSPVITTSTKVKRAIGTNELTPPAIMPTPTTAASSTSATDSQLSHLSSDDSTLLLSEYDENELELQRQAMARFEQAQKDAEYAKQLSDDTRYSSPRNKSLKRAAEGSSPSATRMTPSKKRKGLKQLSLQDMLKRN